MEFITVNAKSCFIHVSNVFSLYVIFFHDFLQFIEIISQNFDILTNCTINKQRFLFAGKQLRISDFKSFEPFETDSLIVVSQKKINSSNDH